MAKSLFHSLRRASLSSLLNLSSSEPLTFTLSPLFKFSFMANCHLLKPISPKHCWELRNLSYGSINLVISEGKPKFETHEMDPPKKDKWKNKKRFKQQRKREKQKRKAANKRDPRWLSVKGKKKKHKFANAEERIKDKLEKAKIKEAMLIERLKRYHVPQVQGPEVRPHELNGEERFYLKKMAQKGSNYVPLGRRGVFGGVILNMHMHWKKHETVKVICKPCKPGQIQDYAKEIARLSGGIPIQVIGDNTIIFYRGKDYVQPEVMSPIDTLSKKRALEKSKYEQSLESVRRFIAIAEKELELYYRHVALYGDPNSRDPNSILDEIPKSPKRIGPTIEADLCSNSYSALSEDEIHSTQEEQLETEDELELEGGSMSETDSDVENIDCDYSNSDVDEEKTSFSIKESSTKILRASPLFIYKLDADTKDYVIEK